MPEGCANVVLLATLGALRKRRLDRRAQLLEEWRLVKELSTQCERPLAACAPQPTILM